MPRGLDIEIVSSEYFSNTIESRLSEDEKEHVTLELRKTYDKIITTQILNIQNIRNILK